MTSVDGTLDPVAAAAVPPLSPAHSTAADGASSQLLHPPTLLSNFSAARHGRGRLSTQSHWRLYHTHSHTTGRSSHATFRKSDMRTSWRDADALYRERNRFQVPLVNLSWVEIRDPSKYSRGAFGLVYTDAVLRLPPKPHLPPASPEYAAAWESLDSFAASEEGARHTTTDIASGFRIVRCAVKEVNAADGDLLHTLQHLKVIRVLGWCPINGSGDLHHVDKDDTAALGDGARAKATTFVIMELGDEDLSQCDLVSMTPAERLRVLRDVANAVTYLVDSGVVHRDVKPANILKCGDTWKLADFGLAKDQLRELVDLGRSEVVNVEPTGGTQKWTDPVCLDKAHNRRYTGLPLGLQGQIDVYSLGKLCEYLFAGSLTAQLQGLISDCTKAKLFLRPTAAQVALYCEEMLNDNVLGAENEAESEALPSAAETTQTARAGPHADDGHQQLLEDGGGGEPEQNGPVDLQKRNVPESSSTAPYIGLHWDPAAAYPTDGDVDHTVSSTKPRSQRSTPPSRRTPPPQWRLPAEQARVELRLRLMHYYHQQYRDGISLSQPKLPFRSLFQTLRVQHDDAHASPALAAAATSGTTSVAANGSVAPAAPTTASSATATNANASNTSGESGVSAPQQSPPFPVSELFSQEALRYATVVVIKGDAGSGKTTQTRWMAREQVPCDDISDEPFEAVLIVPLQKLHLERPVDSAEIDAIELAKWALQYCHDDDADTSDFQLKTIALLQQVGLDKVLWVLDGYDEVQATMQPFVNRHVRRSQAGPASFMKRVIVTTRYTHDRDAFAGKAVTVHLQAWGDEEAEGFLDAIQDSTIAAESSSSAGGQTEMPRTVSTPFLTLADVKNCFRFSGQMKITPLLLDLIVLGASVDATGGVVNATFATVIITACRRLVSRASNSTERFVTYLSEAASRAHSILNGCALVVSNDAPEARNPLFRVHHNVCSFHHRTIGEVLFALHVVASANGAPAELRSKIREVLADPSVSIDMTVFATALGGILSCADPDVTQLVKMAGKGAAAAAAAMEGILGRAQTGGVAPAPVTTARRTNAEEARKAQAAAAAAALERLRPRADAAVAFATAVRCDAVLGKAVRGAYFDRMQDFSKSSPGFVGLLEEACGKFGNGLVLEHLHVAFPTEVTLKRALVWADPVYGASVFAYCDTKNVRPELWQTMLVMPPEALEARLKTFQPTAKTLWELWDATTRISIEVGPSRVPAKAIESMKVIASTLRLNEAHVENLLRLLNTPTTEDVLWGGATCEEVMRLLGHWLRRARRVQLLRVTDCTGRHVADEIAKVLKSNCTVGHLVISGAALSDDCVILLAEALKSNCRITHLELSRNTGFGNDGLHALIAALSANDRCAVTSLNLSHNAITSAGVEALVKSRAMLRLSSLHLDGNPISRAAEIAEFLRTKSCALVTLSLSQTKIAGLGASQLANSLLDARSLTALHLDRNQLDDATVTHFKMNLKALQRSSSLRFLSLAGNHLTDEGVRMARELEATFAYLRVNTMSQNKTTPLATETHTTESAAA